MADLDKYVPWALLFGTTSVPFKNLSIQNENTEEAVRSDGATLPELMAVLQKKPVLRATILDPSLVTDFQAVETGETFTLVKAVWRAVSEEGGPAGAYVSATISKGAMLPVSMSSNFETIATMDIEVRARFTAGSAIVIGTDSATRSTTDKAYRASSLVIGSDTVTNIQSATANWNYGLIQEEMLEPDHYGYTELNLEGSAELSDVSLVNAARLEDGVEETVTLTLTDLETPANTTQIAFGNCFVKAQLSGPNASFSWTKLAT